MRIVMKRDELKSALDIVMGVVPSRSTRPVLQNVQLRAMGDWLELIGTDLEVGIRQQFCPTEKSDDKTFSLLGRTFAGIAREVSDEEIEINVSNDKAVLTAGRGRFELPLNEEDFPEVPGFPEEDEGTVRVSATAFATVIDRAIFSVATEQSRYAINGACLWVGESRLEMAATDGRRLSRVRMEMPEAARIDPAVIVPPKMLSELRKRLRGLADDAVVELALEKNQLLARIGSTTLVGRLIEGNYPKYEDVIPKDDGMKIRIARDGLIQLLRQARLMVNQEDPSVILHIDKGQLRLETRAEIGEAQLEMEVECDGTQDTRLNVFYLLEALEIFSADQVELELHDSKRPAVLREEGADFIHILMPVSRS